MIYDLPISAEVCGHEYEIRSDYRAVLDICTALSDPELTEEDMAVVVLDIFYPNFTGMPPEYYKEAIEQCFQFVKCGDDEQQIHKTPKLMDWSQDFNYIVAPINRIIGKEVRSVEYLHWWSFVSAYYEIGDCMFAQIVHIRDKLARGKPLDKAEREWHRQNRALIELKTSYTEQEDNALRQWIGEK